MRNTCPKGSVAKVGPGDLREGVAFLNDDARGRAESRGYRGQKKVSARHDVVGVNDSRIRSKQLMPRRASPRFCCASFQRESPGCTVITFNFAGPTGAVRAARSAAKAQLEQQARRVGKELRQGLTASRVSDEPPAPRAAPAPRERQALDKATRSSLASEQPVSTALPRLQMSEVEQSERQGRQQALTPCELRAREKATT